MEYNLENKILSIIRRPELVQELQLPRVLTKDQLLCDIKEELVMGLSLPSPF